MGKLELLVQVQQDKMVRAHERGSQAAQPAAPAAAMHHLRVSPRQ
jgi:hypothetical protein